MSDSLTMWWKVSIVECAVVVGVLVVCAVVYVLRALIRRWWR